MNILLSIKPEWARLIYEGKKTIEWRKSTPNAYRPGMRVYLYESVPVQKVTGYFDYQAFYAHLNCNRPEVNLKEIDDLVKQGCVPFENLKAYQGNSDRIVGWIDERNMDPMEPRKGTRFFIINTKQLKWSFYFKTQPGENQ